MSAFNIDSETMHLSVAAILQTIHRAVTDKNKNKFKTEPIETASIAMLLRKRMQKEVRSALSAETNSIIDWHAQVFEPVVTSFELEEGVNVSMADCEYIILLAIFLMIAYEIFLLPEAMEKEGTADFLVKTFERFPCESRVHREVAKGLKVERRRLQHGRAIMNVQRAMHSVCAFETGETSTDTLVETTQVIRKLSDDGYVLGRRNCHRSVIIENSSG